ncbi:Utp14-domain-containing protein [Aulographum hederae CBS 113979]|uniref:Utp14-domain-containing protein n=1 Tax=Aulographum hederae CBS 113979 TaxID=1176131 RepID=A0A6G1HG21_9PEZI|nr:Utp14-domain-containing protein [Aulographum hederae CBS 113979]
MPPRISRTTVTASKPKKAKQKFQKRNLDAFSIASHTHSDRAKVRQHRLGDLDDEPAPRKRQRGGDDEDEEDEEEAQVQQKKKMKKDRFDELDISEGSDSEGNTWQYGHVDEEDDSDIDSDEAFGESDEEKFEGFTFRGSASAGKKKKKSKAEARTSEEDDVGEEVDLDEDMDGDEDESDDSLGDEGVDLATMLDNPPSSDEDDFQGGAESASEDDDESHYSASEADSEDDVNNPKKLLSIQDLISTLPQADQFGYKKLRSTDINDSAAVDEYQGTTGKLDISAVTNDRAARKLVERAEKSGKKKAFGTLEVPLAKRQQDLLDRKAANSMNKETLKRWEDTVKHHRRAEHLSFPLVDPEEAHGERRMLPMTINKPMNDLESTIQNILQESGLAAGNPDEEEEQIRAFEELQTNRMSLEEARARTNELRRARELMFREEIRAKRISKIKSKSYRRVHRKERERMTQRALENGEADYNSEEERVKNDRLRAEARMGARHRDSKWAKAMKKSGRAAWDEDARAGVSELARREDELRRRQHGKDVQNDDESDISSEEDDDEDVGASLQRQLNRVNGGAVDESSSKLGSMLFMQRAEAARKAQNDEDLERLRRDLAGEESPEEDEDESNVPVGRRIFGPASGREEKASEKEEKLEFEERSESEEEWGGIVDDNDADFVLDADRLNGGVAEPKPSTSLPSLKAKTMQPTNITQKTDSGKPKKSITDGLPKSILKSDTKKTNGKSKPTEQDAPAGADSWDVVTLDKDAKSDASADSDKDIDIPVSRLSRNQQLAAKAFAGDETVADFEKEKEAIMADEAPKTIDNSLPGWGSWTGDGITKAQRKFAAAQRNKPWNQIKQDGIDPSKRKDAKNKNVIINEKRVKKNTPYLATTLPHPFTTKLEYERSLRMPVGEMWNSKVQTQENTRPRVVVKKGAVITALAKPVI